jgi:hypothetical protein
MHEEYLKHISMEITEEIKEFVDEDVFGDSEYLFVSKLDSRNIGYCSKCKHEYEVEDLKHNDRGICPICNAKLTVKLSRYGRKKCTNDACFYYFEKSIIDPNVIVCKGYYVTKDYAEDYKNPKVHYELQAIYIFEDKKATMLKDSWYSGWEKKSSIFDFNQGWLAPKMCYCSFSSIKKSIKGTWYQYLPYKEFQGYYSMVKLFTEYSRHPSIEYLIKEGFGNLVEDKLKGYQTYSAINWNGKTIFKILKMSKLEFKEIKAKKVNVTFSFLKAFQNAKKLKWGLSIEEVTKIASEYSSYYEDFIKISQYNSVRKILKYLSGQFKNFNGTNKDKHYCRPDSVLIRLRDYIADCKKLEMDITNEHVLFPKDLYTAHQNTIKQIKLKEDKQLNVAISKRLKALSKYIFENNGLIIRPAQDSLELLEEGKALSHCVGGYAAMYAKGETDILLIRKASEPDKPYYTVEVKKDIIIQVHGKNNRSADKDVAEFIKAFTEEKLDKKQKTKIRIPA